MRRFCIYFFLMILSVKMVGCQSSSQQGSFSPSITLNIGDEPQTLDPRKARDLQCQTVSRMLFEGLCRVSPEEKAELALAESVEISSDLKTFTFHLKEAFWSNGDPVLASDFAYAWKKVLAPDFLSDTAFHLYGIKNAKAAKEGKISVDDIGIVVLDSKTLVVSLESPTPYFLELTAMPAYFPVHERTDRENPAWAQNAATYVGNGPFTLKEWKHQDHLSLEKNPLYWDAPRVQIPSLELQMVESQTELKMFEKEAIDWAGSPLSFLPTDAISGLKKASALHTKQMLGTYFIRANTQRKTVDQVLLRKAFALAINRKAIIEHILQGGQTPATGLVPPSLGLQKGAYFQDADLETARALFSEALAERGITKEDLPEISLMFVAQESRRQIAQALQDQWFQAFGIRVKLEAFEAKVYFDRVSKQDYDLAMGSWIADFPDPINFLEVFKYRKGGSNNTLWENPRYVGLLEESAHTADPQKRLELLAQSEEILMNEMPILPLYFCSMLYVNQPRLQGVVLSSMGQLDFKWAFIDEGNNMLAQGEEK